MDIPHANTKIITVRIAVAKFESTPFIPTFARMETRAAKVADMRDANSQLGI